MLPPCYHFYIFTFTLCPNPRMELHLWLIFHFRILMMNPGFINSGDMRKKVWILGELCQIFRMHKQRCDISLAQKKWGTHIEQVIEKISKDIDNRYRMKYWSILKMLILIYITLKIDTKNVKSPEKQNIK